MSRKGTFSLFTKRLSYIRKLMHPESIFNLQWESCQRGDFLSSFYIAFSLFLWTLSFFFCSHFPFTPHPLPTSCRIWSVHRSFFRPHNRSNGVVKVIVLIPAIFGLDATFFPSKHVNYWNWKNFTYNLNICQR